MSLVLQFRCTVNMDVTEPYIDKLIFEKDDGTFLKVGSTYHESEVFNDICYSNWNGLYYLNGKNEFCDITSAQMFEDVTLIGVEYNENAPNGYNVEMSRCGVFSDYHPINVRVLDRGL